MNLHLRRFERDNLKTSFNHIAWDIAGRITNIVGTALEAHLPGSSVGSIVSIKVHGHNDVLAEVVGFNRDRALLIPYAGIHGIAPGCAVSGKKAWDKIPVGDFLLGQVVDPMMNSLDHSLTLPERPHFVPLDREAPNPLSRGRIEHTLSMGIRAIDSVLTFGEGQRIGIMAGSGVGKSVLMGMIARGSDADVNVIGLIGERGREVREFIERDLGPEGRRRTLYLHFPA